MQNEKKFYFCPYCRTVSYEDTIFYTKNGNKYKCKMPDCKKTFTEESYNDVSVKNGGKRYRLIENGDGDNDVEQAIAIEIAYLYWNGYTIRDIHKITKFSIETVQKAMKHIYETQPGFEQYTKKQFLRQKIEISERDYIAVTSRGPNSASTTEPKKLSSIIIKLYKFGCTYQNIADILNVSSKTISKIINSNIKDTTLKCNHKVSVQRRLVTVSTQKWQRKKRTN